MATKATAASKKASPEPASSKLHKLVEKRFSMTDCLGKGAFASVFKVLDRSNGSALALKRVEKAACKTGQPLNEYFIGKMLHHPNIITTRECIDTTSHLYIVLDLVNGGDLFEKLDPNGPGISMESSRAYLFQMASALAHMHDANLVHSDIKPENCLIHDNAARLCDFGLAAFHNTERSGPALGTGAYMAPELLNKDREAPYRVTKEQDTWSLGIVIYAVLFADLPWEKARFSDPDFRLFLDCGGVAGRLHPFTLLSSGMRRLLAGMLSVDPALRPSMKEVAEFFAVRRPWFAQDERRAVGPQKLVKDARGARHHHEEVEAETESQAGSMTSLLSLHEALDASASSASYSPASALDFSVPV